MDRAPKVSLVRFKRWSPAKPLGSWYGLVKATHEIEWIRVLTSDMIH